MDGGTEHKYNKPRNPLRGKALMVSPAGFEPATTGIRRTALGGLQRCSDAPESLSINEFGVACVYAVALEIPVPWLRGDAVVTDNLISIAPHSRTREPIKRSIKIYHQSSPSSSITPPSDD